MKLFKIILFILAVALGLFIAGHTSKQAVAPAEPVATSSIPTLATSTLPAATTIPIKITSGITGTVSLGPTCPVMRNPPDPGCADKPYGVSLELTTTDGSRVIARFSSDAQGKFKVSASPGRYAVRSASYNNMFPRCGTNDPIVVEKGSFTVANISCDTGIR